ASQRSGSVAANSRLHSGCASETRRPASPVLHTLSSHTQSNPAAASRSRSSSGTSSRVAGRPNPRDSSVSRTRVLSWKSNGLRDARDLAEHERPVGAPRREQVQGPRDQASPSRLVARPQARPVVPVEVLVEEEVVPPVRVLLEPAGAADDRPAALAV